MGGRLAGIAIRDFRAHSRERPRELATAVSMAGSFNIAKNARLAHGYAVTRNSSQGQTGDRVLVHVDTRLSEELVNRRVAYVALSRSRHDAQVFTNDAIQLARALDRDPSRQTALEHEGCDGRGGQSGGQRPAES